jgi:hypothetical protein
MMKRMRFFVLCLLASVCHGYRPPIDQQAKMTLSISEFPDTSDEDGVKLRKVPVETPLEFTVTLKNDRASTVKGVLHVWLNDDWKVAGDDKFELLMEPGQQRTLAFKAIASPRVLSAVYPVHAQMTFKLEGKDVVLHPIALFEAQVKKEKAQAGSPLQELIARDGVSRLDALAGRTFYKQKEKAVELGVYYSSSDQASGTHHSRGLQTRGGISRPGFNIHPPYRNGSGVVWTDYTVSLPANKPASLAFHTAIRESAPSEPKSDGVEFKVVVVDASGVEKEVFTRFSDAKAWEAARVDLSAYAGQRVTLRIWSGPGPKNDTTCDSCFWGDVVLVVGTLPKLPTEAQWQTREQAAVARAKQVLDQKRATGKGAFLLQVNGQPFGAALELGEQGITDGVLAFSDGTRALTYRGFQCEVDGLNVGGVENGQPVLQVKNSKTWGGTEELSHEVSRPSGMLTVRTKLSVEQGVLKIAWDMPGAKRDDRGTPRFTRLALGPCNEKVWRVYAGLGNVIENPGPFKLHSGGFGLSTRHVGADYPNGLSLVQACDVFPDGAVYVPETKRFSLETLHDATFMLIPSAKGAYDAARVYSDRSGFKKGKGVNSILGRMCLDQWGGDYGVAAEDLKQAGRYGLNDSLFVKHSWQRWGYDYRLPEIYPPMGGLEPFQAMREAARQAGILFIPHDNYIDFYPDAEKFSYDQIYFSADGKPVRAWYNEGARALSYKWMPHAFRPWMDANLKLMHDGFDPDGIFIDVFTAVPPVDYYDRAGTYYPRMRTVKEWAGAFDICREKLRKDGPMVSEAGTDALIGSVDAGQSDHFGADRWMSGFGDAERTPWHDMATHGKMILLAGGLGPRYAARDWEDHSGNPLHGYGSDDYLSNTVMGGRNPMCDGPFSRRSVMTYWLLHDVCAVLARETFESHAFGKTIHQQQTVFSKDARVWVNRGSNQVWTVADGKQLPQYGFYVETPRAKAGVFLIDGQRVGFAKSEKALFVDARPRSNAIRKVKIESYAKEGKYVGNGTFDVTLHFKVLEPITDHRPFVHICNSSAKTSDSIVFQATIPGDVKRFATPGEWDVVVPVRVPSDVAAGVYTVRYGFYHPGHGDRLVIGEGPVDTGHRILGGELHVTKDAKGFSEGRYVKEDGGATERAQELNVDGRLLDFGDLSTDGAFRLVHEGNGTWLLTPLPGSKAFNADISLTYLASAYAKIKKVEMVEPFYAGSKVPNWSLDGATFRIACDGKSFAYRIVFE